MNRDKVLKEFKRRFIDQHKMAEVLRCGIVDDTVNTSYFLGATAMLIDLSEALKLYELREDPGITPAWRDIAIQGRDKVKASLDKVAGEIHGLINS